MRTQLNLLQERVLFAEACHPDFRSCVLDVTPATKTVADSVQDLTLRRVSSRAPSLQAVLAQPIASLPAKAGASDTLLFDMHMQAPTLSAKELSTLSLNLGVLDRVPQYFDAALDGERLRHPVEFIERLSNTALESLALEMRTLNLDYTGALHSEDRMMCVGEHDISSFVRKGRSIISQEVNRTVGYYCGINRIAGALRHYYAAAEVPIDNDNRTKPLLRNLCRALTTAIGHLQAGMDIFEQRLRDVSGCNAALKIGASEARPPSASAPTTPTSPASEPLILDQAFTLPNVMRPTQLLRVTTRKQVRALTQFFSDYAQIIGNSFNDWAMLQGNIADLVVVIRDPDKREARWLVETTALSPALTPYNVPEDALSFDEEKELALIRYLQCGEMFEQDLENGSPSSPSRSTMMR